MLEMELAYVYQFRSKSANSRLSYGDKAIFKMAAIRRLEFWKIAVLVTLPVLYWHVILHFVPYFALIGQ